MRSALLFAAGTQDSASIYVLELASGKVRRIIASGAKPRYVRTGHIVHGLFGASSGTVMAAPFDLRRREVTGPAVPVLQSVNASSMGPNFDVSDNGTAVYVTEVASGTGLFVIRDGTAPQILPIDAGEVRSVKFSPEGRRIVFGLGNRTYVHDLVLGTRIPLLGGRGGSFDPIWSRDGRFISLHATDRGVTTFGGFSVAADGTGEAQRLFNRAGLTAPQAWLPDGRLLVRGSRAGARGNDLHIVSLVNDSIVVTPYLRADWDESHATVSPNGRWIAYISDETGRREVYVRPFPDAGAGKWTISERGGDDPVWSSDGRTLFYWEGRELRAARVRPQPDFAVLGRTTVLSDPLYSPSCCFPNYDVHPDGKSFVMARRQSAQEQSSFIVVTNWFEELKSRR